MLILCTHQAEHLVRKGRPLVQQESLDLDVPEVRTSKRSTMELLEAERLDDIETCMVSLQALVLKLEEMVLTSIQWNSWWNFRIQ